MNAKTAKINFTRNFTVSVSPAGSPYYHGWPTVANMGNGVLAAVCSGFRECHICPFGRVTLFRSTDGGKNWDEGTKLSNGPLDDRDAGITLAADGSWLVNYFTSTHGISIGKLDEMPESWKAVAEKITLSDLNREHGFWMLRSADRGLTWNKYMVPVNNVHGPSLLRDGSLIWAGKELDPHRVRAARMGEALIVCRSTDNGLTWEKLSALPPVPWQSCRNWVEAHQAECADGTLLVQFRNQSFRFADYETWQTESADRGKTWSEPHPIGFGTPSHLLPLPDGRILMTYGYRRNPTGNRARISEDNGQTWSEEMILSDDSPSWDMGYPSTARLDDGTFFTLWYENTDGTAKLRGLNWQLDK